MNVEGFGLFLDKFGLDAGLVVANGWVIIINVPGRNFRGWRREVSFQRDALCIDPKRAGVIGDRIICGEGACCGINHGLEVS
jgi:hypothetical protein